MVRKVTLSRNQANMLLNELERIEASDGRPGFSRSEVAEAGDLLTHPIEEIVRQRLFARFNKTSRGELEKASKEDVKRVVKIVQELDSTLSSISTFQELNESPKSLKDETALIKNPRSITARSLYTFLSQLRSAYRDLPEDKKACLPKEISPFPRPESECYFITYSLRLAIDERKNNFKVKITQDREKSPIEPYSPFLLY